MEKFKFLQAMVEENDKELKEREDHLVEEVNIAYQKAIKKIIVKFKELEKLDPEHKVSSDKVQNILNEMIKEFREEFEKIIAPYQKELSDNYDKSLAEAAIFMSALSKYLKEK